MCRIPFFEPHQRWGLDSDGETCRQFLGSSVRADFASDDRNPLVDSEDDEIESDEEAVPRQNLNMQSQASGVSLRNPIPSWCNATQVAADPPQSWPAI